MVCAVLFIRFIQGSEGTFHAAITPPFIPCWLSDRTKTVPSMLCRSSGEGLKHSWAHVQPHYTQAAMDKALEEAMAFGEALSNPWNLKVRCSRKPIDVPHHSLHSHDTTHALPHVRLADSAS